MELTPEEEARLRANAALQGKEAEEFLRDLIAQMPPAPTLGQQILAAWDREGVRGVYADRERYPQDSPELAQELRRTGL